MAFSITLFLGNNSSHSATGILSISRITGDHMAMTVHNGLASNSSDIETDIITGGFFCFLDHPLTVPHQFKYRTFFLTGQVKKILHMTKRDYQHMSFGHRIPVPTGIAKPVLCNDRVSGWGTEGTGHRSPCIEPPDIDKVPIPIPPSDFRLPNRFKQAGFPALKTGYSQL